MLTERLGKEMVYILISFWEKNYLKKSSDLVFLSDLGDLSGSELEFYSAKIPSK